ncbi:MULTISPECIES: 5-(carboxyamino)imidazole ribonucleotide synthase [Prochlorococcus]|uniref:5-(carboxyamino)imidazole ribonucleotide synthase n=1 Tax=Prochlorococcus TaxID=1218 RepID=UPI0005339F6C|nr:MULTISPECIES: 5-(carboxyamino)imidazole ribonucleotide synthase [Prochlorococcus]KGG12545.1 Phosphoribosylaminoimidazole carboxylase ATPase subunit [Prochlorococcus sp. MIT 0601]
MKNDSLTSNSNSCQKIGVVGGGQLAQMLAKAAAQRNIKLIVQTGSRTDPAVSYANGLVLADISDINGTRDLASKCRCITFENEWIDVKTLSLLEEEQGVLFQPELKSMSPLVDKISQRKLLNKLNIPSPEWFSLSCLKITSLKLPDGWSFPLMAKSGRGGYDGKGTRKINDYKELKELLITVDPETWLLEKWISYEKELAFVASRDSSGCINSFPLIETFQHKQVCDWVLAPANVCHATQAMAYNVGASLLRELDYVGVLAIEFFYGDEGLLVNEIAPRTHNSAHFTIDACSSSQFDQQICIAAGLPTPSISLEVPGSLMVNLLGLPIEGNSLKERLTKLRKIKGAKLHWYSKEKETPGRKLGHMTIPLMEKDPSKRIKTARELIQKIRSIWPINVPNIN